MFCTPPATTTSAVPDITACAAKCTACCDEPHCRSTVTPGTWSGSPAASHAVRAMSPACGPTVSTQPKITSSTAAGVDARAGHERGQRGRAQVGGMHPGQPAAAPGDRGADGFHDVRFHRFAQPYQALARQADCAWVSLPTTIPAALVHAAGRFGDREALIDGDSRWTFADLADAVVDSAGALIAAGVERGDRVAVWAPNGRCSSRRPRRRDGRRRARPAEHPVQGSDEAALHPAPQRRAAARHRRRLPRQRLRGHAARTRELPIAGRASSRRHGSGRPVLDGVPRPPFGGVRRGGAGARGRGDRGRPSRHVLHLGHHRAAQGRHATHGQNIRVYTAWANWSACGRATGTWWSTRSSTPSATRPGMLACLIRGATIMPQPVFDVAEALAPHRAGADHRAARAADAVRVAARPPGARGPRPVLAAAGGHRRGRRAGAAGRADARRAGSARSSPPTA